MYDGTAFIEILPTGRMRQLGFLPNYGTVGPRSLWREIRSYKNYMVIGSERENHGIQIFDMTKVRRIKIIYRFKLTTLAPRRQGRHPSPLRQRKRSYWSLC